MSEENDFKPLCFDAKEFMRFVEDEELTEQEAQALLEAVWHIVVAFVDLRLGLSPIQHLVDRSPGRTGSIPPAKTAVLESMSSEEPKDEETTGRALCATVAQEDS